MDLACSEGTEFQVTTNTEGEVAGGRLSPLRLVCHRTSLESLNF